MTTKHKATKSAPSTRRVNKLFRVWDAACKLKIIRKPPHPTFYAEERIDPGVNYFVLMLEQLGAVPYFSCEGHPNGFYVLFTAPACLVERLHMCGFFTIEFEGRNRWSIRTRRLDDDTERKQLLRRAANSWEQHLGPLDLNRAAKEAATATKRKKEQTRHAKLV